MNINNLINGFVTSVSSQLFCQVLRNQVEGRSHIHMNGSYWQVTYCGNTCGIPHWLLMNYCNHHKTKGGE